MISKKLEIWSDSFHEGEWCCDSISIVAKQKGYSCKKTYIKGFIPMYEIENQDLKIEIEVFGSYNAWIEMPQAIKELLSWGKPDFIGYLPDEEKIIFAVEETSATMTGNQPEQRCERQYGSARYNIPFWYLVSEFGVHLDGGVRRDSIWPTIAAFKLSMHYEVPSIVLHYSDEENPVDYASGNGVELLYEALFQLILIHAINRDLAELNLTLEKHYLEMINFVNSQWSNIVDFIPDEDKLHDEQTARFLSYYALGKKADAKEKLDAFLEWPLIDEIGSEIQEKWKRRDLITHDVLSKLLENDIEARKAYYLSNNSSSGRPITESQVISFVDLQNKAFGDGTILNPPATFDLEVQTFAKTENGNYNLTTSKNILYLYDSWFALRETIVKAFPRLKNKLTKYEDDLPAVVYISNSLKPGRVFGDPFTGQLAAYATIFGRFDTRRRVVIAYYPHQAYTYYYTTRKDNKGKTIMNELTDYLLFGGGVAIDVITREVL